MLERGIPAFPAGTSCVNYLGGLIIALLCLQLTSATPIRHLGFLSVYSLRPTCGPQHNTAQPRGLGHRVESASR